MEMCETYETEDDPGETFCEDDLELAAELGKALLERNRELEAQLHHQQQFNHEQTLKLQHVSKQLESLRATSEARNRVYEDMDRCSQDLERYNNQLTMQAKADRQKIDRLTGTVETLEQKVEDLHSQLEEARKAASDRSSGSRAGQPRMVPEKRRTASWASLHSNHRDHQSFYVGGDLSWTRTEEFRKSPLSPIEGELLRLQETVQHLRAQSSARRNHEEDLEVHLDVAQQENINLQAKVKVLEERLSEAMVLEYELEQARQTQAGEGVVCGRCGGGAGARPGQEDERSLLREVEQDEDPTLGSRARAVKLESGGSLYGSQESINRVSSEASEIQNSRSKSILDELETQYKSLFHKYESLVSPRSHHTQTDGLEDGDQRALRRRLAHKEVQTLLHETLSATDFSQQQPPPYRALFDDLFATLRKSRSVQGDREDKH